MQVYSRSLLQLKKWQWQLNAEVSFWNWNSSWTLFTFKKQSKW